MSLYNKCSVKCTACKLWWWW